VRCSVEQPLERWSMSFDGPEAGFELRFEAIGTPLLLDRADEAARAGGMVGYEQICTVSGSVSVAGDRRSVECLGQRGHTWGTPDWERMALARTVSAWLGTDRAVALSAIRPARADSHDQEAVSAFLIEGDPPLAAAVADARLSTVYDGAGRQQRAGLELWVTDDAEFPRRLAGEVVCGSSMNLGRLRLDCSFLRWRMEGRTGVGRYDIVRPA
jgi:hypothetical protein